MRLIGGDEQHEQRLTDQVVAHLGDVAGIEAQHVDVEIFDDEIAQAIRRITL